MPYGLIPARGSWEYRWFRNDSAATFAKGSLVGLGSDYEVEELASTDSQYLGIAMSHSTASIVGRFSGTGVVSGVMVAIPRPGCTAMADIRGNFTQSNLSIGRAVTLLKDGNYFSYVTNAMGEASRFSAYAVVAGPIQADTSQVEIAFTALTGIYYSASSATLAS